MAIYRKRQDYFWLIIDLKVLVDNFGPRYYVLCTNPEAGRSLKDGREKSRWYDPRYDTDMCDKFKPRIVVIIRLMNW